MSVQNVQLAASIEWDGINAGLVTSIDRNYESGFIWIHCTAAGWLRIGQYESVKVIG